MFPRVLHLIKAPDKAAADHEPQAAAQPRIDSVAGA
jgi:hypothetical protein